MLTIASDRHRLHHPRDSIVDGGLVVAPPEIPERAERILAEIAQRQLGPVEAPDDHGVEPIRELFV